MKICHVTTDLEQGGAEAVLYRLISADHENQHHVISLMDRGFYGERLAALGIPVDTLDMRRGRVTFQAVLKLYRVLGDASPDLVQTWMYHADLIGGIVSRFAGTRTIVWGVHHSNLDARKTGLSTRLIARTCAALSFLVPTRVICCSAVASEVHAKRGYRRRTMVIVPNGLDLSEFKPDAVGRRRIRAELQVGHDDVLLGMVGRWDPQKDHANLIAALEHLLKFGTTAWRCVLVGPGMTDDNPELMSLLLRYDVRDRVHLLGARTDIPAVMSALDVHVLSSSGEAFGNVTVEAMACGAPAIVTSVGAGASIVGDTGWVVPPADSLRLARAIHDAAESFAVPAEWRLRQTAARERVAANFGLDRMVQAYRKVWSEAVG